MPTGVDPDDVDSTILPPEPTRASTNAVRTAPRSTVTSGTTGRLVPYGYTVRAVVAVARATVTCSATAETPLAGTPARPVTCIGYWWPVTTACQLRIRVDVPSR